MEMAALNVLLSTYQFYINISRKEENAFELILYDARITLIPKSYKHIKKKKAVAQYFL